VQAELLPHKEGGAQRGEPAENGEPDAQTWNEALYLAVNPDVAAAIARHEFKSGREHYELAGRAEHRQGGIVPNSWNESQYLSVNPDVAAEVRRGTFVNGYHHYLVAGSAEGRSDGTPPREWNEALYLRLNPDVQAAVARGTFSGGYHHYLAAGRVEGRITGMAPDTWDDDRYLRFYPDVAAEVRRGTFISGYHHYLVAGRAEGRSDGIPPSDWNEALYLKVNPNVQSEVARGTFVNGYHHWLAAGRSENREGGTVPRDWDEATYLQVNPDVEFQVAQNKYLIGYHHYLVAGRAEKRAGGYRPSEWNEAKYLASNPTARIRIALGEYRSGYAHYAAVGRSQGLSGGFSPADLLERVRIRWPQLNNTLFQINETFRFVFSTTVLSDAVATVLGQSEHSSFNDAGVRLFDRQDEELRQRGGIGKVLRVRLGGGGWGPWITLPKLMYCFTNADTGMTMFDPFRFMLRRAYAEGTDLRLFVTPLHAVIRAALLPGLGLDERYEFWLKELVRINEEEAALADKEPLPLWDFSNLNTVTRDRIPDASDPGPMRWYWEYSHYRKQTGDLILDRILGHDGPELSLAPDFGVRLTSRNVDEHIARTKADLQVWASANHELASPILWAGRNLTDRNYQSRATCW